MSRLETALMQVTVGCRPSHANLTALHAGAQRLHNRARYREMESDVHHTGEITLLHPSPGIAANRTTYTVVGVETAMGTRHGGTSSWLPSAETTPSLTLQKPGQKYSSFCP